MAAAQRWAIFFSLTAACSAHPGAPARVSDPEPTMEVLACPVNTEWNGVHCVRDTTCDEGLIRVELPQPKCVPVVEALCPTWFGQRANGTCERQCPPVAGPPQTDFEENAEAAEAVALMDDALELLAEGDTLQALEAYRSAGDLFTHAWQGCEDETAREYRISCRHALEMLWGAAHAYALAGQRASSMASRRALLDLQNGASRHELVREATHWLALDYAELGEFDQAIRHHRAYLAWSGCQGEHARVAVTRSVGFEIGRGSPDQALSLLDQLDAGACPHLASTLVRSRLLIAEHLAERGALRQAAAALDRLPSNPDLPLELEVRLHVLRGRAHARLHNERIAGQDYDRAVALWSQAGVEASVRIAADIARELGEVVPSDAQREGELALGRALDAVGEALFFQAERETRAQAPRTPIPRPLGSSPESMLRYEVVLRDWVAARTKHAAASVERYKRIVDLQPVPPPRWVIEAGAAVGRLHGSIFDELLRVPPPPRVERDPELKKSYRTALAEAAKPYLDQAKGAMVTCLGYATKYGVASESSRSCEAWLAEHYPREYVPLFEIVPAPSWQRLEIPASPLLDRDRLPLTP